MNQVLPELPVLGDLVKNLYDCHYDKFFVALGEYRIRPAPAVTDTDTAIPSNPRTNTPPALTAASTPCTLLRPRDAHPCVHAAARVIPQPHHREPEHGVRRQRGIYR